MLVPQARLTNRYQTLSIARLKGLLCADYLTNINVNNAGQNAFLNAFFGKKQGLNNKKTGR